MILNMWLQSDHHDRKPIKVRVVNGVPVGELIEDVCGVERLYRLTESGREHYMRQIKLLGYSLSIPAYGSSSQQT